MKLFDLSQRLSASEFALIQEARTMYDRIFPPADPISEQQDKAPVSHAGHTVSGANAERSEGVVLS
jgi:hypothetical protein